MKGDVIGAAEVAPQGYPQPEAPLRIDIGCGRTKMDGWTGIDLMDFGQPWFCDLASVHSKRWVIGADTKPACAETDHPVHSWHPLVVAGGRKSFTLPDNSVDEARSSHFVEHLTGAQRIDFFNELYRVMKPGATALIVTPNWSHACAYGDPTHQWPPVSEWSFLYLNMEWRDANAPHVGYTCNFAWSPSFSIDMGNPDVVGRTPEVTGRMARNNTNVMRDMIVTLTAIK